MEWVEFETVSRKSFLNSLLTNLYKIENISNYATFNKWKNKTLKIYNT